MCGSSDVFLEKGVDDGVDSQVDDIEEINYFLDNGMDNAGF